MNSRGPWHLCSCVFRQKGIGDASGISRHVAVSARQYATATKVPDIPLPVNLAETSDKSTQSTETYSEATIAYKNKQRLRALKIPKPKEWHVVASVLLSRPPLLVPELHPFEREVQRYQEMIEQHHYSPFPVNFFFKQGSIAEKRWKQQNRREPKRSGSGILRHAHDQASPEWIVGGISDEQVMKSRANAPPPQKETEEEEEELTDDERRDLEQYSAQEEAFEDMETDVPDEVNWDMHRLERVPRETLYCLIKKSAQSHLKSGRPDPGWSLIDTEAPGVDGENRVEGLHMAACRAIERHLGTGVQTWVVGTSPAAHISYSHEQGDPFKIGRQQFLKTRAFILKAHIFAGTPRPKPKYCRDYAWVTRDEMEHMIDRRTLQAILPLLARR